MKKYSKVKGDTKGIILSAIDDCEFYSVRKVSIRTGLSKNCVRKHLNLFTENGTVSRVEADVEEGYGMMWKYKLN